MTQQKHSAAQGDQPKQPHKSQPRDQDMQQHTTPKPESSSEYEGAPTRKPTGNPGSVTKTETSSSSGQ
jgi:hypothetical protein